MIENRILIAEDEIISATILEKILSANGYEVTIAKDGEEALTLFNQKFYPVVISDLNMPKLIGQDLIKLMMQKAPQPLIIVQSVREETELVIEIMKTGVYDYIVKPINPTELLHKVEKAFEVASFRKIKRDLEKEYQVKLDKQLSWNSWKESIYSRDRHRFDQTLFHNMRTTLTQGIGFGGLLSLIPFITSQAKTADGKYVIDEQVMSMLLSNVNMARKALDRFREIDEILHSDYPEDKVSIMELYEMLKGLINEKIEMAAIKNQTIKINDAKPFFSTQFVAINKELFRNVFEELLINSMKFSEEKSSILILLNQVKHTMLISFLTTPLNINNYAGIPDQFKAIIFEPFSRLDSSVDERYHSLDFGVGLTMVEKIIHKFHGFITASNMQTHLDSDSLSQGKRVKIEIELPVSN
jgi:DNA-binding response OmpR family regulator